MRFGVRRTSGSASASSPAASAATARLAANVSARCLALASARTVLACAQLMLESDAAAGAALAAPALLAAKASDRSSLKVGVTGSLLAMTSR